MKNFSDIVLVEHIKNNDHNAFDVIFQRYWKKLYQTALARLDDQDTAQDIVQEIFIKIWQRRESLDIRVSLENYLQSAVRLSVISHYRSKKASRMQLQIAFERITVLEDSIHSLTDYLELEKTLEEAVNTMPEMLKIVYQLRSDNHSIKAIARKLGLADQTVKNYISEVARRLRSTIAEKYPEKHLTYIAVLIAMLYK